MKRVLKIIGWIVAVVVVLIGGLAGYVALTGIPHYSPGRVELHAEPTPERVARGRKFATLLCAECHMDPTTRKLTGKLMAEAPAEFGPIFSRNITRDPNKGIGSWTDGELAYLLRTGIARDGRYIPPYMAKLPHLADEDLRSIIAFLRSDDPMVAAAAVDPPGRTQPSFLTKLLTHSVFKPLPYPEHPIAVPKESDTLAFGRYLVVNLDCWTCHSADFKTMNVFEPEKSPGYLGGGNIVLDLAQRTVLSANITSDEQTGIGRWSEADFIRAMRNGIRPDGRPILFPMTPTPELNDAELSAMYAYLKSMPKIHNPVARAKPPAPSGGSQGKQLYYRYGCFGCHGDNGIGIADLRKASEHYPTEAALIQWIKNAPAIKPGTRMPKWEGVIKEEEFPVLAAYVRELGARK